MTYRTISASNAKTHLGEVLESLPREGPITITRNGHKVATLSPFKDSTTPAKHLDLLARLFAQGSITSRQACDEAGVAFGDLLVEMARQGLQLPRVSAQKRPEQAALLDAALSRGQKS